MTLRRVFAAFLALALVISVSPFHSVRAAEDTVIAAPDTNYILRSAAVLYTEGNGFLERGDTTGTYADDPLIDTLLTQAPGEFNKAGEEWLWLAYKISVPADGSYTLGVTTNSCKNDSFKLPMVVNHEVYTLSFTAKAQTQTVDVTLPAGEHVVTVFWPMPANASAVDAQGDWANYIWANIASVTVDSALTVSKPTAAEVEAAVKPNTVISAVDDNTVLWSAAMGDNGNGYLEFNSRDAVKADKPYIESLLDAAPGQFNKSGEEWGWFAYQVTAPSNGTYTLALQLQNCRNAPYYVPLFVNGKVYTLSYSATGRQSDSVDVTLTKGEHTVVMFAPMPVNAAGATGEDWVDYPWANPEQLTVDAMLTVSKPTVAEVEACFAPAVKEDAVISAVDGNTVLWSAAMGDNGNGYLEFNSRDAVKADKPYIESLLDAAPGQFNKSGEEWGWFAYQVTAPSNGTYTLALQLQNCRNAPYYVPLYVNGKVYTLSYSATGRQSDSVEVTLTKGAHTVVMFAPMPVNAAGATGEDWVDYPWANPEQLTVDAMLTVSKPTVAEVEACFPVPVKEDTIISAPDTNYILRSANVKYAEGSTFVERGDYSFVGADAPRIDTLLDAAPGQFNASGEEWIWIAYKISAPADGTYTLGVTTVGAARDSFKIPMVVNGEVYTLTYTAKAQTVTAEVTLPAGEHVVTIFWPMPANESEVSASGNWYNYPWANIANVTVDSALTVSKPTAAEVEACFPIPVKEDAVISAVDTDKLLLSATIQKNATALGRTDQATMKADQPTIETLYLDAFGQFNKSGEEWNWFAYKVSVPEAGTYTLGVKTAGSKYDSYKLPLCVNGEVYALQYTAKSQAVTTEVTLPAGEHVVVMFMPMPAAKANITNNEWNDYHWCDVESVTVDGELTVSKPTVAEVEAVFAPITISAVDTDKLLLSATIAKNAAALGRTDQATMKADQPTIESLYTDAFGQFNKSGEEWNWFAYKVTVPADGTYTLGVKTTGSKYDSYKLPLCVNGEVYALQYTAKAQEVTAEVTLPAGEHVVVMFMPMPAAQANITNNEWNDYHWCDVGSVIVQPGMKVTKPTVAEVEACFPEPRYTRVEAEDADYVIYNNYNTTNEANAQASGGMVVGGAWNSIYEQTFEELVQWLDIKHNAYVEYAVVAPADGEYDIRVGFLAGSNDKSIAKPYIAVIVNGATHKVQFTKDWNQIDKVELTVSLKKGLNIIRCTSITTEQAVYGVKGWINQDFLDVDTRLTPVKHSSITMEAENAKYYNNLTVQNGGEEEGASGKVLGKSDRRYVAGLKLTLDQLTDSNLRQVPYFSVTVNAPMDGYYPIRVGMSSDGRLPRATVGMIVDGVMHAVPYARTSKTTAGGRVDALVYLTAGEHVITFTTPMPATADPEANYSYYWSNYDYVELYDGLELAQKQKAPTTEPKYVRVEVEEYAMFNLNKNNGTVAGNAYYRSSQSIAEMLENGIDGGKTPYVELTVQADKAGPYVLYIGVAVGMTEGNTVDEVDAQLVAEVNGTARTKWVYASKSTNYTILPLWVTLKEGTNTIRLTHLSSDAQYGGTTWIDFDYIEMPYWETLQLEFVKGSGEVLEAENAKYDGFGESTGSAYSSGRYLGRANYDTVAEVNLTYETLDPANLNGLPHVTYRVFAEKAGTYAVAVGFAAGLTNYTTEETQAGVEASLVAIVNGETKQRVEFMLRSPSANMTRLVLLELKEGENEVTFTGTTSEYVIDRIPRNDETYRLVWIDQDYLLLGAGLSNLGQDVDPFDIEDSAYDFGQLVPRDPSTAPTEQEQPGGNTPAPQPEVPVILWVLLGIGVVAILFFIILIGKKRKKDEEK